MGKIREILSKIELPFSSSLFEKRMSIEEAERIHFHWRNLRVLFTPRQYDVVTETFNKAIKKWDGKLNAENDLTLHDTIIPGEIIFNKEVSIEEQEDGTIHFHYQDLRLELRPKEFLKLTKLFNEAWDAYFPYYFLINMGDINPYDDNHPILWGNEEDYILHRKGIDYIKEGLKEGRTVYPIAVRPIVNDYFNLHRKYERLDGYKRYMAYMELGVEKIPAIIYTNEKHITPGMQQGKLLWWKEDNE